MPGIRVVGAAEEWEGVMKMARGKGEFSGVSYQRTEISKSYDISGTGLESLWVWRRRDVRSRASVVRGILKTLYSFFSLPYFMGFFRYSYTEFCIFFSFCPAISISSSERINGVLGAIIKGEL